MNYRYVWFDLGMTLVHNHRAQGYKRVLRSFDIDKLDEEIERAYHLTDKLFMREYRGILSKKPEIFTPWYYGVLNYYLGVALDLKKVCRKLSKIKRYREFGWVPFDYTIVTINELKVYGLKVGLITNWDEECRNMLKRNGLSKLFDTTIISSEIGYEKPAKEIFEIALNRSGVKAPDCIYIGDNYYDDVAGSAKVGMTCLLINPYGKLGMEEIEYPYMIRDIREIKNYLFLNDEYYQSN